MHLGTVTIVERLSLCRHTCSHPFVWQGILCPPGIPHPAHNYFAEQLNSICAWWWTALTTILVAGIKDESSSSSSKKNCFWNLPLMPIAYNKTTCDSYDIHKSCLSLNLCSGRLILSGLSNLISYLVISQSLSHNDTMSAYNLLSWNNLSLHSSWCSTMLVLD